MRGQVFRIQGNTLEVRTPGGVLRCSLRGRLKQERQPVGKLATVGDHVDVELKSAGEGIIEKVLPRRTKLSRPDPHNPQRELIMVANVDMLVIVQAAAEPAPDLLTIDKCTVMGLAGGIASAICVNKVDLAPPPVLDAYAKLGIPVITTSALRGDGLDELQAFLLGKTSVFLGPSGVGKSTLLNALMPGLSLKTGAISDHTGEGRHTTTWAELVDVGGARVMDTPGLEFFNLWGVTPDNLRDHFPEFPGGCKFRDCSHTKEPKCAVRNAASSGAVPPGRYANYLKIRKILQDQAEFFA